MHESQEPAGQIVEQKLVTFQSFFAAITPLRVQHNSFWQDVECENWMGNAG